MSISAVFLLFKLDSSNTVLAKDAPGGEMSDANGRKGDMPLPLRVQGALNRLLDATESPVALAALAGAILAADLAFNDNPEQETSEASAIIEVRGVDHVRADASTGAADNTNSDAVTFLDLESSPDVPLFVANAAAMLASLVVKELTSSENLIQMAAPVELNVDQDASLNVAPPAYTPSLPEAQGAAEASSSEVGAVAKGTSPAATPIALSLQVLGDVTALDWTSISLSELAAGVVVSIGGEFGLSQGTDLEVQPLSTYGFASETTLEGDDLMMVLRHIISGMGRFELTSEDGVLVVEQLDINLDDPAMLGVWSNVAESGGSMKIIGQMDLIDDVAALLAADLMVA